MQKLRALRSKTYPMQELVQSRTVDGLMLSLRSAEYHRTLNAEQMQGVVEHFNLDDAEQLLLYAALIAMWPQAQLIAFGVPYEETWKVVIMIGDHIIGWLRDNDTFMRRKGVVEIPWMTTPQDLLTASMEPAMEAYDAGVMASLSARYIPDPLLQARWQQLALFHFARAANQLDQAAPTLKQEAEWQWWRLTIQHEINTLLTAGARLPELHAWP